MDIQIIISVFSLLGIGGAIGYFVKYFLLQKDKIKNEIRILNEEKYRTTLIFMRVMLNPSSIKHFCFSSQRDESYLRSAKDAGEIIDYCKDRLVEYYYHSFLYASDDVISGIKEFIDNPVEDNFVNVANLMRKDLWGKSKIINKKNKLCK